MKSINLFISFFHVGIENIGSRDNIFSYHYKNNIIKDNENH